MLTNDTQQTAPKNINQKHSVNVIQQKRSNLLKVMANSLLCSLLR